MSTVGYGDVYCETVLGRTFLVFFLLVGLVSTFCFQIHFLKQNDCFFCVCYFFFIQFLLFERKGQNDDKRTKKTKNWSKEAYEEKAHVKLIDELKKIKLTEEQMNFIQEEMKFIFIIFLFTFFFSSSVEFYFFFFFCNKFLIFVSYYFGCCWNFIFDCQTNWSFSL